MFKNDERYWDINLLNKWFAISSLVFLAVIVWMFIDDNDDEFKEYQKEFRKLQVDIAKNNLEEEQSLVKGKTEEFEAALEQAVKIFDQKSEEVKNINSELGELRAGFYNTNLTYSANKAKLDVLKFQLESANLKSGNEADEIRQNYEQKLASFDEIKLNKEQYELDIAARKTTKRP